MIRLRSLRLRALLTVVTVVLLPLAFVWMSWAYDLTLVDRMSVNVSLAAEQAARNHEQGLPLFQGIEVVAGRHAMRLRVLDEAAGVVEEEDQAPDFSISLTISSFFLDEDPTANLTDFDHEQPPLAEREVVRSALAGSAAVDCGLSHTGRLMVCAAARPVAGGGAVYVQESSRRAARVLHSMRYDLIDLTMGWLVVGALLGGWLGWRMVQPIEQLSEQVRRQRDAPGRLPVRLDRDDEFGDLARAFDELMTSLDERKRSNQAFMADFVHEMKNPVAAIRACAESMEGGDARSQRLARVLKDSSGRLDGMVSRFLELARAEAGLPDSQREAVDLGDLAKGVVAALAPRYAEVSLSCTVEGPVAVYGVPERLETAIRNLVENAASLAGSVSVAVTGGEVTVRVLITDDGPGIDESDLPRVFDRFFTRRAGGTGLGLALVQAVAQAHGGQASVTSQPGQGAVFCLELPRQQ